MTYASKPGLQHKKGMQCLLRIMVCSTSVHAHTKWRNAREIRAETASHAVSRKHGLKTYKAPATPTMKAIEGL